jgi:hypothetical protein
MYSHPDVGGELMLEVLDTRPLTCHREGPGSTGV